MNRARGTPDTIREILRCIQRRTGLEAVAIRLGDGNTLLEVFERAKAARDRYVEVAAAKESPAPNQD